MNNAHAARLAATLARTSTATLVASAYALEAQGMKTPEERMVAAWTADELERRMGGVADDEAFCALLDRGLTYTDALVATFPALAAA